MRTKPRPATNADHITVTLPDGTTRTVPADTTAAGLAEHIGPRLAADAVIAIINGHETDLNHQLCDGDHVELVVGDSDLGRHTIRHSTAHLMAKAICDLYPGTHLATGPATEFGFFYDVELPDGQTLSDADLEAIEARMHELVDEDEEFFRHELAIDKARQFFAAAPYKIDIIDRVTTGEATSDDAGEITATNGDDDFIISFYATGSDFVDMCTGPHVPTTGHLRHFKLQSVAGAYWRGDTSRPMLQRIHGTAWHSPKALKSHGGLVEFGGFSRRNRPGRRFG